MHFFGHKILINKTGLNIILTPPPHIPFAHFSIILSSPRHWWKNLYLPTPLTSLIFLHTPYTCITHTPMCTPHHLQHTFVFSPTKNNAVQPHFSITAFSPIKIQILLLWTLFFSSSKNVATPTVSYPPLTHSPHHISPSNSIRRIA